MTTSQRPFRGDFPCRSESSTPGECGHNAYAPPVNRQPPLYHARLGKHIKYNCRSMPSHTLTFTLPKALGVASGLGLSLILFSVLFSGKTTRFDEAALGDSESVYAVVDGVSVHCKNVLDADRCIAGAAGHASNKRFLWLGNSQLHAINQRKAGDRSAPEILHRRLRSSGGYLVTFSEPNASLQEHLVLFAGLLSRLRPDVLVLPLVFDDFRETGIRAEILPALREKPTRDALGAFEVGKALVAEADQSTEDKGDFAGIAATVQERSERILTQWLSEHSTAWAARPEARGQTFLWLYQLRNAALGIKPTTSRKMIPGRFAKNWAALEAILALARQSGMGVYLYIVPIRNDVKIPYVETEYAAFKQRVLQVFGSRQGIVVLNLERAVANGLWGTKASTSLGDEPEYDFMHFQAKGHQALADALFEAIVSATPIR